MALKLNPPGQLNFRTEGGQLAERWKAWKETMSLYLDLAMKANTEKERCQAILYIIGEEGRTIHRTWTFEEDERDKVNPLLEKFEEYCIPKTNVTLERYKFNTRTQHENEQIDEYLTELRKLSINCNFGQLENELLRDRIVVGVRSQTVKERMLRETDLTLGKALDICRAEEQSKTGIKIMDRKEKTEIDALQKRDPYKKNYSEKHTNQKQQRQPKTTSGRQRCQKCLLEHTPRSCPAFGKKCLSCGKFNHYAKACRNPTKPKKKLHEVEQLSSTSNSDDDQDEFLVSSLANATCKSEWNIVLNARGENLKAKVDTGAQANVMSKMVADKLQTKIDRSKVKLTSYSGDNIPVEGKTRIPCFYKDKKHWITFIVTSNEKAQTILGLQTSEDLGLVKRVDGLKAKSLDDLLTQYKDTFGELGKMNTTYHMRIDETVEPIVAGARKVPFSQKEKVQEELKRMAKLGVIAEEGDATDWVNPMIVVNKPNGKVRLCLDPQRLNSALKREYHQIPTVEEISTKMTGAKLYSKLDASSGFYQIPLDKDSSQLCTFATPFGRYRFLRMPFGISSAPEVYQKAMDKFFGDLEGVTCYIDDLCVWSTTIEEHIQRLETVFQRAQECGLKFNKTKCEFLKKEVTYLGHIFTQDGVQVDPRKVSAIQNMPTPQNRKDLLRFLGMVTYLNKFIPDMSAKTAPLRQLLEKDAEWQWTANHDKAFESLKESLMSSPTLRFFDVKKGATIECDASKDGLGAVLLQDGQPVAYASRSMSSAEQRYAQIEKETLAIVFSLERFHQYVYGRKVQVWTDHKPIVAIMKKPFNKCPARIQRFLLRMQLYDIEVAYKKGSEQVVSDTLSRATELDQNNTVNSEIPEKEVQAFVDSVVKTLHATPQKIKEIKKKQEEDKVLNKLREQIQEWPDSIKKTPKELRPFWTVREDITECDGILLKGDQIIIPEIMKSEILTLIHQGHMGIQLCQNRAKSAIFWPGMLREIEETVGKCSVCQRHRNAQQREPLLEYTVPNKPWTKIASDLFHFEGKDFLLVCDYYSKYFEVARLDETTSGKIIQHLKIIFARHGIPVYLVTDNGPQYASRTFKEFAQEWNIQHITTSPRFPRSNGFIERNVQTVKQLFKKAKECGDDPNISIMNYRATPKGDTGKSPAELLMGRKIRTQLPMITSNSRPNLTKQHVKSKIKTRYDQHSRSLPELSPGDFIRFRHDGLWEPAQVLSRAETPRSYIIKTKSGTLRRNRQQLLLNGETHHDLSLSTPIEEHQCPEDQQLLPVRPPDPHLHMPTRARDLQPTAPPEGTSSSVPRSTEASQPPITPAATPHSHLRNGVDNSFRHGDGTVPPSTTTTTTQPTPSRTSRYGRPLKSPTKLKSFYRY